MTMVTGSFQFMTIGTGLNRFSLLRLVAPFR